MSTVIRLKEFLENKYKGHDFKFKGNDHRLIGLCPEHDDHNPSFNVFDYNGKAYYKCFSCGFKGSLYDFIGAELTPEQKETYENNKKAQGALSETFKGLKDYLFSGDTVESVFARKYLTETRFLDIDKINKCDIGLIRTSGNYDDIDELLEPLSSDKPNKLEYYRGYLVFAHTDATGNICLLRFRSPGGGKDIKTAKIKSFSNRPYAFNLQLIGRADADKYPLTPHIYITEGEFNSLTYISQTHNYNVCSAGPKDNVKKGLINSIIQLRYKPVIALDQDKAGQDRLKKLYPEIKNNKQIIYCEYDSKDFDDLLKNKSDDGVTDTLVNIRHREIEEFEQDIFREQVQKEIKIEKNVDKLILSKSLKKIYLKHHNINPLYSQCLYNIPADIYSKITDEEVFGIKIQYPSIFALAGSTGTGKTEFALELADYVAQQENHVSIYYQYEGSEIDLLIRAQRKNINNPDFFYSTLADFKKIEKDIIKFGEKKIFIVIDYYQLLARFLQSKEENKNDSIRPYMSKIFFFFTELNKKHSNICVCLLSSLSNDALKNLPSEPANKINNITILSGLKEDGDIAYNMDYVYSLLFANKYECREEKYSISKYDKESKGWREFTVIFPIKSARIGLPVEKSFYTFNIQNNRYSKTTADPSCDNNNFYND